MAKEVNLNDPNLEAEIDAQEKEQTQQEQGGAEMNASVEFEAKSFDEEVKALKNDERNKIWPNLKILTITYGKSEDGQNEFVTITVDKPVFRYNAVKTAEGTQFKLCKDNKVTLSFLSFLSGVKYGGGANRTLAAKFRALPNTMNDVLADSTIELIQVPVKKDVLFDQPFTVINKQYTPKNDAIFNYITKINCGETAAKAREAILTNIAELYAHI